jgi:hypothetical protein
MLYGKSPFIHENPNLMYGKILEEEPVFPKEFKYSEESTDLIKKLLKKVGTERIGNEDEQEIFTHPWFNEIDFAKLVSKKLPAIIIPHVDEISPMQNAETGEDKKELELSFEKEEKKAAADSDGKGVNQGASNSDPSFEDFSYFEEDDFVETPCHDDLKILDPEFEEERRIQLLTNIEERSMHSEEDETKPRDALHSPRHEDGEKPNKTKEFESDDKLARRKASIDALVDIGNKKQPADIDKIERKGSGSNMPPSQKKQNSTVESTDTSAPKISSPLLK